jgi:hypothetical protein
MFDPENIPLVPASPLLYSACEAMKTVCGLLILILFAHLQCGGLCYAPSKITAPPCHQSHSKEPASTTNSPCAQQSVVVSTAFEDGRTVLAFAACLPIPAVTLEFDPSIASSLNHETPPSAAWPALTVFNLRI